MSLPTSTEALMFNLPWTKRPARASAAAAEPVAPDAEAADMSKPLYAARQPILGRDDQVFGYEILFRDSAENRFSAKDADKASASSIETSAAAFGLTSLVGERLAFVNLTKDALLAEYFRMLPKERTVLELLETIEPDAQVLDTCRRARAEGYRFALDDYTFNESAAPLLEVADIIKVDFRLAAHARKAQAVDSLKTRGLRVLAEKVETIEEHRIALAAGYDYFQGYYYCKPEMVQTRDLPPAKVSVLRFMAEVAKDDVSFDRLEDLFRTDPGLTLRLLRYLNSAAFGWRHEIPSMRQALAVMGLRPLRKWATMLGMMQLCDDRPRELAVTALSRGRFAERIGPATGLQPQGDDLFLTGMLSLVDTMVGRPIPEIIDTLSVPDSVRTALLAHENPLGPVLDLVTAYEQGDWKKVDATSQSVHVNARQLDEAYVDSLQWAEETVAA